MKCAILYAVAPIAQLDRVPDYGSGGWGFDSSWARHYFQGVAGFPAPLPPNTYYE
jgi:hypothetical protein